MLALIFENTFYCVWPLKISESPASKTAIVEHLYSFPHAVPSSIYVNNQYKCCPSKALCRTSSQGYPQDRSLVVEREVGKPQKGRGVAYVVASEVVNVRFR